MRLEFIPGLLKHSIILCLVLFSTLNKNNLTSVHMTKYVWLHRGITNLPVDFVFYYFGQKIVFEVLSNI